MKAWKQQQSSQTAREREMLDDCFLHFALSFHSLSLSLSRCLASLHQQQSVSNHRQTLRSKSLLLFAAAVDVMLIFSLHLSLPSPAGPAARVPLSLMLSHLLTVIFLPPTSPAGLVHSLAGLLVASDEGVDARERERMRLTAFRRRASEREIWMCVTSGVQVFSFTLSVPRSLLGPSMSVRLPLNRCAGVCSREKVTMMKRR